MTRLRAAIGLLALPLVAAWNRLVTALSPVPEAGTAADPASGAAAVAVGDSASGSAPDDPAIVEHERGWLAYLRGFDAHHGPDGSPDGTPADGSLLRGLRCWVDSDFLRGYTLGNDVYVLRSAPAIVRIHQAGHAPAFGAVFAPLAGEYRDDGGLPDEPLHTLDVMLPGDFPHTFLRLQDSRGLRGLYRDWVQSGRIERVEE